MRPMDFEMDDPVTCDVVAEIIGARRSLVLRLARQGLIETIGTERNEPLLPRRAVMQLRRMQRLRRDLGVNFNGAAIILDLVTRIERLHGELLANSESGVSSLESTVENRTTGSQES